MMEEIIRKMECHILSEFKEKELYERGICGRKILWTRQPSEYLSENEIECLVQSCLELKKNGYGYEIVHSYGTTGFSKIIDIFKIYTHEEKFKALVYLEDNNGKRVCVDILESDDINRLIRDIDCTKYMFL